MNNKPIIAQVVLVPEHLYPLCHTSVEIDGIFESITVSTLENTPIVTVDAPSVGKYKLLPLALAQGLRGAKVKEIGFFAELAELMDRYNASFEYESSFEADLDDVDDIHLEGSARVEIRMPDGYRVALCDMDAEDAGSIVAIDLADYDTQHERWLAKRKEAANEQK